MEHWIPPRIFNIFFCCMITYFVVQMSCKCNTSTFFVLFFQWTTFKTNSKSALPVQERQIPIHLWTCTSTCSKCFELPSSMAFKNICWSRISLNDRNFAAILILSHSFYWLYTYTVQYTVKISCAAGPMKVCVDCSAHTTCKCSMLSHSECAIFSFFSQFFRICAWNFKSDHSSHS